MHAMIMTMDPWSEEAVDAEHRARRAFAVVATSSWSICKLPWFGISQFGISILLNAVRNLVHAVQLGPISHSSARSCTWLTSIPYWLSSNGVQSREADVQKARTKRTKRKKYIQQIKLGNEATLGPKN